MLTRNGKRIVDYFNDNENTGTHDLNDDPQTLTQALEPPSKKAKKMPKISDGKYFVIQSESDGNIQAKCTICGEVRKGNIASTGNFLSHYKKKHSSLIEELKTSLKANDNIAKSHQPTLVEFTKTLTPDIVSSKILNFVVDGNLSFNVAQMPSLRDLLETVSGRKIIMPTRHKFVKTLDTEFNQMKIELIRIIKNQKYLCVTADVWSSRAQSYLGVTIHFLNRNTEKRESFLLAFKQMYLKQTYTELAKAMNEIFAEFDIKTSQITNIVTDGGSAFCKMFRVFGNTIDVTDTTYSEICDDSDKSRDEEDLDDLNIPTEDNIVTLFMEDINGEQFVNNVLEFESVEQNNEHETIGIVGANSENFLENYFGESNTSRISEKIDMPPQRRCVSHLLHLLSKDFEETFLTGLPKKALCQSLSKLHSLFVLTRRSSRAKTICKTILKHCLKVPCETRWNSRFDAVKMCTRPDIQPKINDSIRELLKVLGKSAQNLQLLLNADFAVINLYVKVLEPVAIALDFYPQKS